MRHSSKALGKAKKLDFLSIIRSLLRNIRFYILFFSLVLSLTIFFWTIFTTPQAAIKVINLTRIYAFCSITFLYFALLCGPFCYTFRSFPYRPQYLKARRAIGVSAFYFALLHSLFAFFGVLGGFKGLGFLDARFIFAIALSFVALIILSLMAATSFDFVITKMTFKRWKILHRLVYIAGIFVLIHALLIGSHFQNLLEPIPLIYLSAVAFLLYLEAKRVIVFLQKKLKK